jgi:hypothetical protein
MTNRGMITDFSQLLSTMKSYEFCNKFYYNGEYKFAFICSLNTIRNGCGNL